MFILSETPLEARHNPHIYYAIIIAIILMAIFLVVNIIVKIISEKHKKKLNDPNRLTTKKDINLISKILNLNLEEKNYLWTLCEKNQTKNFWLQLKNDDVIDTIFKKEFSTLSDENIKSSMFSLRNKIDFYKSINSSINSTKTLKVGQQLIYIFNSDRYLTNIIENNDEGLILSVPKDVLGNEIQIQPLSKISLSFSINNNLAYILKTRVIRYQKRFESELVVTHSNNIQTLHRRNQKRVPFNPKCVFSAVKVISGGNQKQTQIEYEPLEKKHIGTMVDISSNGCCLQTELPIKTQQYIHMEIEIEKGSTDELTGIIVESENIAAKNLFILHIRFVRITSKTRNKIYSLVYDYN